MGSVSLLGIVPSVIGACIGLVVYRLFLHPLANIPGPKVAAWSTLYELYYDVCKGGRLPWKLDELHAQWGPIVRIGPNEVHIRDPDFTLRFFATATTNRLDKHAPHRQQLGVPASVMSTIDSHLHRRRREALAPFLSSARVAAYAPVLASNVENMASHLEKGKSAAQGLELRCLLWYMATDLITELAFPAGTNLLGRHDIDTGYYMFQKTGQSKLQWFKHFPFLWTILKSMPTAWLLHMAPEAEVAVQWETANKKLARDILLGNDSTGKNTAFHHLIASSLSPSEKRFDRVWEEVASLMGAGSETVSNTLCTTIFYVLNDEEIALKLTNELYEAIADPLIIPPIHVLASLPYLSAVIQEGVRKAVGVSSRFVRVDKNNGTPYKSYMLPPGTAISVSSLLSNNDPSTFPHPQEFRPERWLEDDANVVQLRKRQVLTFGGGPRRCLGEHLAQAELFTVMAVLFRRFKLRLCETSERDVAPMYDSLLPLQWEGSKGVQVQIM